MKTWLYCLFGGVLLASGGSTRAAEVTVEVRDSRGNLIIDSVVYATPAGSSAPAPHGDSRVTIDQVNKEFVPRVSVVRAGSQVFFPNSDNIRHSIYSFSPAKTFATKLYSGREAAPVLFDKTGLVVLGCNIHDQMVAWVLILDTPWFAKTNAEGVVTLRGLPPGEYQLTATAPSVGLKGHSLTVRVDSTDQRHVFRLEVGS